MSEYDFHTLSSYDFERLVRDLLQKELGVRLESFKRGKDTGVDLRYAPVGPTGRTIVQCKHYAESGFDALLRHLENSELPKVKRLAPDRYILATSVPLLPQQADKIKALLYPFMQSTADCIGQESLNNLLEIHEDVQRSHFKLWLSSSVVLDRLINSAIYSRTESDKEKILRNINVYVQTDALVRAQELLDEHHCCIISGMPGIGKTSLAEMLVVEAYARDWSVIKVSADIEEAWARKVPEVKQLYYYDDFLGQTALTLRSLQKNEDDRLVSLIRDITTDKGKRLVMTTREYLLQEAKQKFEKIARAGVDFFKMIIDLESYSPSHRAHILLNHLYFSKLPREYTEALAGNAKALRSIIDHRNYNPRVVEWMTTWDRVRHVPAGQYAELFIHVMDNPDDLWRHAYAEQINEPARCLLQIIVTFPGPMPFAIMKPLLESLSMVRAQRLNIPRQAREFEQSVRLLEGSLIKSERSNEVIRIRLNNPSIEDFMFRVLAEDGQSLREVLVNAVYFEQLGTVLSAAVTGKAAKELQATVIALSDIVADTAERLFLSESAGNVGVLFRPGLPRTVMNGRVATLVQSALLLPVPARQRLTDLIAFAVEFHDDFVWVNSDLVSMILRLRSLPAFMDRTSAWLRSIENNLDSNDADDLKALFVIAETLSDDDDDSKLEELRDQVRAFIDQEVESALEKSDVDDLESTFTTLYELQDTSGVNPTRAMNKLEEHITEIKNMSRRPDEDEEWRSRVSPESAQIDTISDVEIQSMFDSLTDRQRDS